MRPTIDRYDRTGRWTAVLLAFLLGTAMFPQTECAQRFDDAKTLFDNGDRLACITTLDSALDGCGNDRDLKGRLLFLKALAEAGEDSLELMGADLERLFRTDRHYVIKAYDPLMKGKSGEADLYGAWEELRNELRNDLGRWRVGVQCSLTRTVPRITTAEVVYSGDELLEHGGSWGWDVGATMEWDAWPNVAIRGSASYARTGFDAQNAAITYHERITAMPLRLAVKKTFQVARAPVLPYLSFGGGTSWLLGSTAEVERDEGSDTRYLKAVTVDRLEDRRQRQYWGEASLGISRKTGSTVVSMEGAYQFALTTLNKGDHPYGNKQLLVDFYYTDARIFLDTVLFRMTVAYIIAYHSRNRIHL